MGTFFALSSHDLGHGARGERAAQWTGSAEAPRQAAAAATASGRPFYGGARTRATGEARKQTEASPKHDEQWARILFINRATIIAENPHANPLLDAQRGEPKCRLLSNCERCISQRPLLQNGTFLAQLNSFRRQQQRVQAAEFTGATLELWPRFGAPLGAGPLATYCTPELLPVVGGDGAESGGRSCASRGGSAKRATGSPLGATLEPIRRQTMRPRNLNSLLLAANGSRSRGGSGGRARKQTAN